MFPALAAVMPMMTPVMVPEFYDHLRRSWNNRSRKHNKRNYCHQQPRQFSFQSRPSKTLSSLLDGIQAFAVVDASLF
jgi:hypothetical protein